LARKPIKKAANPTPKAKRRGRKPANGVEKQTQRQRTQKWREGKRQKGGDGVIQATPDAAALQQCYQDSVGNSLLPVPSIDRCKVCSAEISVYRPLLGTRWAEGGFGRARKPAGEFLDRIAEPRASLQSRYQLIQARGVPDSENPFSSKLKELNQIEEFLGPLLEWDKATITRARDWRDFAHFLAWTVAIEWRMAGHHPRSVKEGAPICRFVYEVLKHCGYKQKESAISAVLYGRRGPLPRLDLSNL
jgi:hypothetical protein